MFIAAIIFPSLCTVDSDDTASYSEYLFSTSREGRCFLFSNRGSGVGSKKLFGTNHRALTMRRSTLDWNLSSISDLEFETEPCRSIILCDFS